LVLPLPGRVYGFFIRVKRNFDGGRVAPPRDSIRWIAPKGLTFDAARVRVI